MIIPDMQPNLYNGKEYEQVHGYDMYDFGARGYYATIARFTSIDPLAENTPWQSPYSYTSNNFIAEIDWMGLSAFTQSFSSVVFRYTELDDNGVVIAHIDDEDDKRVILVDDEESRKEKGLRTYIFVYRKIINTLFSC